MSNFLWHNIVSTLDSGIPDWRNRIDKMGQVDAVKFRNEGNRYTDKEIFFGVVKAVLSTNIDYSKIECVIPELHDIFKDFDIDYYANLNETGITKILYWFTCHNVGGVALKNSLTNLINGAKKLRSRSEEHGSLENYFDYMKSKYGNHPINLVHQLGATNGLDKIASMGIPIAAEAMKNIGYDVAKPDRHINRAFGIFFEKLVPKWTKRYGYEYPSVNEKDLRNIMIEVDIMAKKLGLAVVFLDNAVWLLCCKSGLHLTNEELVRLSRTF